MEILRMDSAEKRHFFSSECDSSRLCFQQTAVQDCQCRWSMASQHRTIIHQIGTDVEQTDILELLMILAGV